MVLGTVGGHKNVVRFLLEEGAPIELLLFKWWDLRLWAMMASTDSESLPYDTELSTSLNRDIEELLEDSLLYALRLSSQRPNPPDPGYEDDLLQFLSGGTSFESRADPRVLSFVPHRSLCDPNRTPDIRHLDLRFVKLLIDELSKVELMAFMTTQFSNDNDLVLTLDSAQANISNSIENWIFRAGMAGERRFKLPSTNEKQFWSLRRYIGAFGEAALNQTLFLMMGGKKERFPELPSRLEHSVSSPWN